MVMWHGNCGAGLIRHLIGTSRITTRICGWTQKVIGRSAWPIREQNVTLVRSTTLNVGNSLIRISGLERLLFDRLVAGRADQIVEHADA
jgi:hypothetical protein